MRRSKLHLIKCTRRERRETEAIFKVIGVIHIYIKKMKS